MIKKLFLGVATLLGLWLTFGSEGSYHTSLQSVGEEERPSVTLSHGSWDDNLAVTHLFSEVLKDEGFDVELVQLDMAIIFSSLATSDSDFSVSIWLPTTHGEYLERYGDQIENLGPHTTGAMNGLVVPAYMDVDSIADLTDEAGQVITGIEPGAGVANRTDEALSTYPNLADWTHQTSSTGAMTTALTQAIESEEEIVVSGWSPHWKFIEYDLKYLEDPEGVFSAGEDLVTTTRQGFQEDYPRAYQIIDNIEWELKDMEQVMLYMHEGMAPEDAARRWMEENPEKVAEWTEIEEATAE